MFHYALYGFILSVLVIALWKYWTLRKRFSGIPQYSLLGLILKYFYVLRKYSNPPPFTCVILQYIISAMKKFQNEGVCMVWFGHPFLLAYNKEAIKIFSSEHGAVDHSPKIDLIKEVFGNGLIASNGNRWRIRRKLLNPVFHVGQLKTKLPVINEQAQGFVKKLYEIEDKTSVNVLDFLKTFSLKVLVESILGLKINSIEEEENYKSFVKYIDEAAELAIFCIGFPMFQYICMLQFLPSGRRFLRRREKQNHFIEKVIMNMKKHLYGDNVDGKVAEHDSSLNRKSFGHILLDLHMKDPSFTIEDIKDEVITFIASGYDTISHALLWCLFMLGNHPEVQERAINEVDSILETSLTYDDLQNLPYLECVIKETMRLYPPLPIQTRYINKDTLCGKYLVPKGTSVCLCPYMLHRDPKIYPNPENFDPERFLDKSSDKSQWIYTPFGEGFRYCIGKRFALIEMTVFLAHILRNFRVTSVEKEEDVDLCFSVILIPSKPITMRFYPRK